MKSNGIIDTRRLTVLSLTVAVALVATFIESRIPPLISVAPGAKMGLGNIAPLIALIVLGVGDAYIVTAVKCLLGAFITGGVSGLMYSVPSGFIALTIEVLLFAVVFDKLSVTMISIIGAVVFNLVQLLVASLITGVGLMTLLPLLVVAGAIAGAVTGLLTYHIVKKLPYSVFGSSRR